MNERIKELSQIAQKYIDDNKYEYDIVAYHHGLAFRDKFAELIVKECASICEHRYTYMNKDMSEGAFEAMACHDSILEHFGIE